MPTDILDAPALNCTSLLKCVERIVVFFFLLFIILCELAGRLMSTRNKTKSIKHLNEKKKTKQINTRSPQRIQLCCVFWAGYHCVGVGGFGGCVEQSREAAFKV